MRLLRKPVVLDKLGNIGNTNFEENFRPRLREGEVELGPRTIVWTEESVDALIAEILAARDAAGPEAALQAKLARTPIQALKTKKAAQKPPPVGERKTTTSAKPPVGKRKPQQRGQR